jgi:Protein of unknown function (DUF1579)
MKKISVITAIFCIVTFQDFSQSQADSSFYKSKESKWLTKQIGMWNVTMTIQPTIDSKPIIINGIEVERSMVGAFCLHEVMQPSKGENMPLFKRISDLDYNFNEEKWDYISIDTRITAGIMFFTYSSSTEDSIVSYIQSFPHPGLGPKQTDRGKIVRVRNVVLNIDKNHDVVKQYWKLTDGKEWLAITYDYIRKR